MAEERAHSLLDPEHLDNGIDQQLGAAVVGAGQQLQELRIGAVEVERGALERRALLVVGEAGILLGRIDGLPVDLERRPSWLIRAVARAVIGPMRELLEAVVMGEL